MRLSTIDCGNFMCDGGAAFGIIPKMMWSKCYPVDENNLINLTLRSLVADNGSRVAIIDTGMGNKLSEKFLKYQFVNGEGELIKSLKEKGYNPINQLVGYILSEDPTYITNYNNARSLICRIDRDDLLQELLVSYLSK